MTDSRKAFEELSEAALVDLAAALEDIQGTAGFRAIVTVISRLEADVALRALDGTPEELPRFQGQREALTELRAQLERIRLAGRELADVAVAEGRAPESELERFAPDPEDEELERQMIDFTRPGGADFG